MNENNQTALSADTLSFLSQLAETEIDHVTAHTGIYAVYKARELLQRSTQPAKRIELDYSQGKVRAIESSNPTPTLPNDVRMFLLDIQRNGTDAYRKLATILLGKYNRTAKNAAEVNYSESTAISDADDKRQKLDWAKSLGETEYDMQIDR